MDSSLTLTVFLVAGGAFALFCSILNFNWFLRQPEEGPLKEAALAKRKLMRVYCIIVGAIMLIWGLNRVINPPRYIPVVFLEELRMPSGIHLGEPGALEKLQANEEILSLKLEEGDWNSFETILPSDSPHYIDARDAAVAGPDFTRGFSLPTITIDGAPVGGALLYYNPQFEECNNVLFSSKPISSAAFAMVICKEDLSGEADGLRIFFARNGGTAFKKIRE